MNKKSALVLVCSLVCTSIIYGTPIDQNKGQEQIKKITCLYKKIEEICHICKKQATLLKEKAKIKFQKKVNEWKSKKSNSK
ncbi:MAG: hypothetical protein WBQ73_00035 [Candidatus Babeliales bacterium]